MRKIPSDDEFLKRLPGLKGVEHFNSPGTIPCFECGTKACILAGLSGMVQKLESDDGGPLEVLVATFEMPFDIVSDDECLFNSLRWLMRSVSKHGKVTLVIKDPHPNETSSLAPPRFGMLASRTIRRAS